MTRIKMIVGPLVSCMAGVAMAVLVNGTMAQARIEEEEQKCPNTWCGPGMEECIETTNWKCFTDGSHCSGAWRCDQLPQS